MIIPYDRYNLTVLVPGLRNHYWQRLYNSIANACKKYSFEVIFAGPFDCPPSLIDLQNIKYIKGYDTIPVTMQKSTLEAEGQLICHTTDDAVLYPDSLDNCIEQLLDSNNELNVINMRYKEGSGFSNVSFDVNYWRAGTYTELQLKGIDPNWNLAVQPMMYTETFKNLGGFDCQFEYSNHCHHDLMFRLQKSDGKVIHSCCEVASADHMPGKTGDHGPIHDSQIIHDTPIFNEMYKEMTDRTTILYDNYKQYEGVWKRRFPQLFTSYNEMMEYYSRYGN